MICAVKSSTPAVKPRRQDRNFRRANSRLEFARKYNYPKFPAAVSCTPQVSHKEHASLQNNLQKERDVRFILENQLSKLGEKALIEKEICRAELRAVKAKLSRRDRAIEELQEEMCSRLEGSQNENDVFDFCHELINESGAKNPSFLSSFVRNASSNVNNRATSVRHLPQVISFALYVRNLAGPLLYNFLQKNLQFLPHISNVDKKRASVFQYAEGFDKKVVDDYAKQLKSNGSQPIALLSEDGSAILPRITWCETNDTWSGFVFDEEKGAIKCDVSHSEMKELLQSRKLSSHVYAYMIVALDGKTPPCIAACIGSDNKFCHNVVLKRQARLRELFHSRGISIVVHSADGDPKLLKSMQLKLVKPSDAVKLGKHKVIGLDFPWFVLYSLVDDSGVPWIVIQDPIHCLLKIRNVLVNEHRLLVMGDYMPQKHDLKKLLEHMPLAIDLFDSDIDVEDKQNYPACVRYVILFDTYFYYFYSLTFIRSMVEARIHLAQHVPNSLGTQIFLEVIAGINDAMMAQDLDVLERISRVWYSLFFLRLWRMWILSSPEYSLKKNFITSNAYVSVETIAQALISLLIVIRDKYEGSIDFIPALFGSRACDTLIILFDSDKFFNFYVFTSCFTHAFVCRNQSKPIDEWANISMS